jgi:hypothetical protein
VEYGFDGLSGLLGVDVREDAGGGAPKTSLMLDVEAPWTRILIATATLFVVFERVNGGSWDGRSAISVWGMAGADEV